MRPSLMLAALLCFTTWMSIVHATHGPVANCLCIRWSNTQVQVGLIVNYTIQSEGICPLKAIVFHTKKDKNICSNPDSPWAQRAILKVDKEKNKTALQEMGQNGDGSSTDITPAVSTTSKNAPQKRGPRRRRGQRRKSRGLKRWQRKRF